MRASLSSFILSRRTRVTALRSPFLRACLLAIALGAAATQASVIAQNSSAADSVREEQALSENRGEQVSDSAARPVTDPATILRNARVIYIRKNSVFFKAPELENELLKRPQFQRWGLIITRTEPDADLIIEVGRKVFTRYVYTVIDRRTDTVVASGKLSSLGGNLSTKIAKRFIEQMQRVRP